MTDDAQVPEPASVESPLSMRKVFDALTPPGTDGGKLLDALKAARQPVIPLSERSLPPRAFAPQGGVPLSGPADPFSRGAAASAALAEMYQDMVGAGIPVASVEAILGHMLASHARNESTPPT